MSEKFDIKKLLSSPMSGLYWVKCFMIGSGIFILLTVGYAIYKAFIKKPLPSTTQQAEQITNHYYTLEPKQTFGCISMRVFREKFKEAEEVKQ